MPFHCCSACDYRSPRKFNVVRHMTCRHPQIQSPRPDCGERTCKLCCKAFSSKWYAEKHEATCNGVANSLECAHCHNVYASAITKCRHLRVCPVKADIEAAKAEAAGSNVPEEAPAVLRKKTRRDVYLMRTEPGTIMYNGEFTEFTTEHITAKMYKSAVLHLTPPEVLEAFLKLLLKSPTNRCVVKRRSCDSFSFRYVGRNIYKKIPDKEIYTELSICLPNVFQAFMAERQNERGYTISERLYASLDQMMNWIGTRDGDCDNIQYLDDVQAYTRTFYKRIKRAVGEIADAFGEDAA